MIFPSVGTLEVTLGKISGHEAGIIVLPEFVSSIHVVVDDEVSVSDPKSIPDALFLGGNDWTIPDYDCSSSVRFEILDPKLNHPLWYAYGKNTNRRFYGRKWNEGDFFMIHNCLGNNEFPVLPSALSVNNRVVEMKDRFLFPGVNDPGFLAGLSVEAGGFAYYFDPEVNHWLRNNFREMAKTLVGETSSKSFRMLVQFDIGNTLRFHGEFRNVREDAQELLQRISQVNGYSVYDVSYYVVGPQDWKSREKTRKKWKKPIHQELGTATLADGFETTVKLRIEKEGYVFTLDFEDVDAMAAFRESKLFKMTQWNDGAE